MDGIRLKSVSARFRHQMKGDIAAVHDVSLDVAPGELVTLLGPSGCGKTTTLRMIAGFQEPSAGEIWIGDHNVTTVEANERNIGFVFQNYALFPHLSVFENAAYGLRVQKLSPGKITRAVTDVLALVGLASYERQMPHQLSGGEQQRVALARAIVIRPRVLLFDEPLSNLDATLRVHMRGEIRRLQKDLSITAVYVTHDQEEAMAVSDRIAVMSEGAVVARTFLGEKVDYQVQAGEHLLLVTRSNSGPVAALVPGQRVRLRLPVESVRLLRSAE